MFFAAGQGFRTALGAINPAATGGGRFTTPTDNAGAFTPDATSPDGFYTSDRKLVWLKGAWRVNSDPADQSKLTFPVNVTAHEVVQQGNKIFAGPFVLDPNSTDGQITTLISPSQLPPGVGDWVSSSIASLLKGGLHDRNGSPITTGYLGYPFLPMLAHQYLQQAMDYGFSFCGGSHDHPNTNSACTPCATATDAYRCIASQMGATQIWFDMDANGIPTNFLQYPDDPYTYGFYTEGEWLEAMKKGLTKEPGSYLAFSGFYSPVQESAALGSFDAMKDRPPLSKFAHPLTGELWGVWLACRSDNSNPGVPLGKWNSSTDRPTGFVLDVIIAPIPQEPWWEYISDAIMWLPLKFADAIAALISEIQSLVCSNPAQAAQLAKNDPRAMAALVALEATCGRPATTPINCSTPLNALNPICVINQLPWWQQWYVIVPAIGAVVVAVALARPHKQKGAQQ